MNNLVIIGLVVCLFISIFGCVENKQIDNNITLRNNNKDFYTNDFDTNFIYRDELFYSVILIDANKDSDVLDLNNIELIGRDYSLNFYLDANFNWKQMEEIK